LSNCKPVLYLVYSSRAKVITALAAVVCFVLTSAPTALAQKVTKSERKVLVSVKPEYSELLRHAQIGGLVRLRVTVAPDGKVNQVEVLGGNPILSESAAAAVMKWKYAPAAGQTVEDVSVSLTPH
jgi:TonB family protein